MNTWVAVGAISGAISVIAGAFGAHALAATLTPKALEVFRTGAQYQMYHSLALLGLGLWGASHPNAPYLQLVGYAFSIGILLFSGSLYVLALTDIKILGAITPFGGVAMILGWIAFAVSAWKS